MEPSPEDVILEEEIDPNYEPTEEELVEYATWLGMDLTNHKDLLWIAKEALIAPLPSDWKPCLTEEDEIYYFNFTTGRSIWDHPCDEYYRQVYKEEVEKLNKSQQVNQTTSGSCLSLRDQQTLAHSNSISSQRASAGDLSSRSSSERVSARDLMVGSRSLTSPPFPSSSNNNYLSRSLPPPYLGRPAMPNVKGGSFDSMIRLYAAGLVNNGGSLPLADFLKMQGSLQVKRNDTSTCVSTTSFDEQLRGNMIEEKRLWLQGDERQAFEKKISQIKDRIEKKLVDEERVVLQQERVEMLERVCKQVQEESSHVLDSLRREIKEHMETNIREETQALLSKRREEIISEVETEIQAEKRLHAEKRRSKESKSFDSDTRAMVSKECSKAKEAEASSSEGEGADTSEKSKKQKAAHTKGKLSSEGEGPAHCCSSEGEGADTSAKQKAKSKKQLTLKKRDNTMCAPQREQDEAESLKTQQENEGFSNTPNVPTEKKRTQNMQTPIRIASRLTLDQDEEEGSMKDSSQKVEAEERRFEKSFHVQDLRTSLMLKLEVFLKVGTSND